ncbi:MAG: hypothetical protein LBG80_14165 [Bacteroidales bacterium]|jgi:DNA polymerase-3 subunit epsilon|nr:hypothetical protein [Bacteroidales bacterium]
MDFITIDFETATAKRNSPCEIGLTIVENDEIKETKSWLIRPINNEFSRFNIRIHGILPSHVENAPEFDALWDEIKPLIHGQCLIAHNAAFDISVLRNTLELYEIPFPKFKYLCSYFFSKKIWKGLPAYDLKTLCNVNGIDFKHHRAGDDSRATAELCLKAFEIVGVPSIKDFVKKLDMRIGNVYEYGGYDPCKYNDNSPYREHSYFEPVEISRNIVDVPKIEIHAIKCNPDSIFYGKNVVFTGTLMSMTRDEACQTIINIGGVVSQTMKRDVNYLIVGQQDYRIIGDEEMSLKQKKAIKLVENGYPLEIMSESDFLNNL